ncbi:MAG: hypothetical protein ACUVQM_01095 [Candidatus Hadarchaeaceae archaeon]
MSPPSTHSASRSNTGKPVTATRREVILGGEKVEEKAAYGRRWAAEAMSSDVKRPFGEFVATHEFRTWRKR